MAYSFGISGETINSRGRMGEHPKVTEVPALNAELVAAYYSAPDPGPAFMKYIRGLGFEPPGRSDVITWGICVTGDDEGSEWLAWDAEEVRYPGQAGAPE